jgi:hypothetical protein
MAATSPFDGRPSDPPEVDGARLSFVRSVPPSVPPAPIWILRIIARCWRFMKRLVVALIGGGSGILLYMLLIPNESRHFQPDPTLWGSEAPFIIGMFFLFAIGTLVLSRSWKHS